MPEALTEFDYLLNRFERASQAAKPAELGYAEHRRAVYAHVRDLERRAALASAPAAEPSNVELRGLWYGAGGSFHGPNVETGTMPEEKLLPFLRSLIAAEPATQAGASILAAAKQLPESMQRAEFAPLLVAATKDSQHQAQMVEELRAEVSRWQKLCEAQQIGLDVRERMAARAVTMQEAGMLAATHRRAGGVVRHPDTKRLDWIISQGVFKCRELRAPRDDTTYEVYGGNGALGIGYTARAAIDDAAKFLPSEQEGNV